MILRYSRNYPGYQADIPKGSSGAKDRNSRRTGRHKSAKNQGLRTAMHPQKLSKRAQLSIGMSCFHSLELLAPLMSFGSQRAYGFEKKPSCRLGCSLIIFTNCHQAMAARSMP